MTIIRTLSAFALATAFAAPAFAQPALEEVKAAEKKRFEVTVKKDYKALDALLADDLIYVHSNGNTDNEKTFLEGLTSGRSTYLAIEPISMNARRPASIQSCALRIFPASTRGSGFLL